MSTERQPSADFQQITDHALALPVEQRFELAHKLWESVEEPPGVYEDEEFIALLRRRAKEIDDGTVQLIDREDAMRGVREALAKRRCE